MINFSLFAPLLAVTQNLGLPLYILHHGQHRAEPGTGAALFYVASVLGYVLGSCLLITQTPANYFLGLAFVAIAFFMASEMSGSFTAAPYPPNRRQSVLLHCRCCSMPPSLYRDMHPRL